ncbi:hypothetical protein Tco_0305438 [Tanacetum coccineum]
MVMIILMPNLVQLNPCLIVDNVYLLLVDLLIEEVRSVSSLCCSNSTTELLKSTLILRGNDSKTVIDSNNDYSSSNDDSCEDIDYVNASPPDSELVSLEVVEISSGFSSTILSDLFSSAPPHPTSLPPPDYEAFYLDDDHIKEKSSGSTTTHADFSQYDSFIFDLSINPFPPAVLGVNLYMRTAGELAHSISPPRRPRVHVPNVFPTHPTLHLDSDFTLSSDSLGFDPYDSFLFPSGN